MTMTDSEFIEWAEREKARMDWIVRASDYAKEHLTRAGELKRIEKAVAVGQKAVDDLLKTIAARTAKADAEYTAQLAKQAAGYANTGQAARAELESLSRRIDSLRAATEQAQTDLVAAQRDLAVMREEAAQQTERIARQIAELTATRDGLEARLSAALKR